MDQGGTAGSGAVLKGSGGVFRPPQHVSGGGGGATPPHPLLHPQLAISENVLGGAGGSGPFSGFRSQTPKKTVTKLPK